MRAAQFRMVFLKLFQPLFLVFQRHFRVVQNGVHQFNQLLVGAGPTLLLVVRLTHPVTERRLCNDY